ncbi:MAG: hypothetical protein HY535_00390 [Chloroflexi bacterium]|nr:hypothetical protein [Chloroflexota bacterium]
MTPEPQRAALVQRATGLAEELAGAVHRSDWDQVFLIAQELQRMADLLTSPPNEPPP